MLPENIVISSNLKEELAAFFKAHSFSKIAVLMDENTQKYCLPLVAPLLGEFLSITIESGEENKNLQTCTQIWQQLTDAGFDRSALVINLGGGVIGDMGGFCASAYKRGIQFINLPTTLLAQVDASIGGKLGIDFGAFKNHIGFFKEPLRVFVNSNFLSTLPKSELRSGFAEVIKHGLIADVAYWRKVKSQGLKGQAWEMHIEHSILTKYKVVQADPFEKGLRKILNFGHTVGHAIEGYFLGIPGKKLLHGEAVAIGMICEAFLSVQKLGLTEAVRNEITEYVIHVFGKVVIQASDIPPICQLLVQDKKNKNNKVMASLLDGPGSCQFDQPITPEEVAESIRYYQAQT